METLPIFFLSVLLRTKMYVKREKWGRLGKSGNEKTIWTWCQKSSRESSDRSGSARKIQAETDGAVSVNPPLAGWGAP